MGKSGGFMANNFGLLFGGIWLVVGVPFLIVGLWQWQSQGRFAEEAVRVEGKVLTKEITRASRESRSSTRYSVRYRFEALDEQSYEGRQDIDVDLWEALEEQGPIELEYIPDDPHTNRVAGQGDWVLVSVFTLLGGAFTLAGGIIFGISLRKKLARSRLRREGQLVGATVTGLQETNMSVNRVRQWRILYSYRDLYGVEHQGKSGYLSPQEAQRWEEGDQGQAYHDPQQPEKSLWVGNES